MCSVGRHRGAAGDGHTALALTDRGGADDRGVGLGGQQVDGGAHGVRSEDETLCITGVNYVDAPGVYLQIVNF
ncbi:hypothetical protein [Streptomyces violascens]|uniref:hypothetical protein n=1 Tax=Streptomyces violascens TaxID=67381 RepID=UPI001672CDB2|nr:hypothetical protein [Streptomyces violascens]GGU29527.1 hypothetical protein GCM10010289_58570 [Streptomyces violascens]